MRSIAKALTWRAIGSLATFVIAYLITASVAIAVSLVTAELLLKFVIYYFHERLWSRVTWGRRPRGKGRD